MQYNKLTKKELEEYGRTLGIELDRRKKKDDLISAIKNAEKNAKKKSVAKKAPAKKTTAKKTTAKKAPAKKTTAKKAPVKAKAVIHGQPVVQPITTPTETKTSQPKTIIERIRNFFNL